MVGLHEMREILVTPEVEAELVERERVAAEQRQQPTKKIGVLITLISVALFVNGQHWMGSGDWTWIVILVGVLLVHELGHLLAMRLLGFSDLGVFFIPFFGAAAAGRKDDASATQHAIVSLAGPVPGVVLGATLAIAAPIQIDWVWRTIVLSILLNLFNLLPAKPLDGGRFLDTVLFRRNPTLQLITSLLGGALLIYLGWRQASWLLGGIGGIALLLASPSSRANMVARTLRERIGPSFVHGDALPPEYREPLAHAVAQTWGFEVTDKPKTLVALMLAGWKQAGVESPPMPAAVVLLAVYVVTFALGLAVFWV